MLIFKCLRYRNLLSTGKVFTELDFQASPTTLIIGKNGHGKSSLIDALFFVLYGKPYRKITKPQLVNSINKKDLLVELEFETNGKEYLIRRGIKPNIFEIFCDDKLIDQSAAIKDYQEILEQEILKLDSKSFRKIVVLAKTDYVPYMQLPAAARREFTEDLLDLKIFSVMNTLLKERVSNNKTAISDVQKEIQFSQKLIENIEKNQRERSEDSSELLISYQSHIAENKESGIKLLDEMSKLSFELVQAENKLEGKSKIDTKINELKKIKTNLEYKISGISTKINFYVEHDDCSECGQHIDENFKNVFVEANQEKIDEYNEAIEKINFCLEKQNEKIKAFRIIESSISMLEDQLSGIKYQIKALQESTKSLLGFVAKIEKQKEEINVDELLNEKNNLKSHEENYQQLHKEKENLSVLALLLKDGGLKSKIIKKYIPIINQHVSKYLEALDLFVSFELNEDFEETVKSRFRDTFSYSSFSQGEALRIDLALCLTFRAIARMRNNNDCNILVLDETFDASLDKEGVNLLLELLKEDQVGNSVFVISHNTDDMGDLFDRTLLFSKVGNFSQMEELE